MGIAICFVTNYNFQDINHETDYQAFRKKWGNEPRFLALDRKDRENLFNERYHLKIAGFRSLVLLIL